MNKIKLISLLAAAAVTGGEITLTNAPESDMVAVTAKLREMGYGAPEVKPVPCFFPETDFSKIDWYRIIAQKQ